MPVLDKWAIYDRIMPCSVYEHDSSCEGHPVWNPHVGQLKVAENNARNQIVAAGRRWGKSYSGGMKLLPEVFYTKPMQHTLTENGKRREFWIVGPNYSDSEKEFRVIWNTLRTLGVPFDQGSRNSPETGDMVIKCWDNTFRIEAKSAKDPDRLVGEGLSGVILSEAAKLKEKVWFKYIRPTLADFKGWSYMSSTPEGKNWFYELWRKARHPENHAWEGFQQPAWVNQHVYTTPTNAAHVKRLLELQRENPNRSVFQMAAEHNFTIDIEVLQGINDATPEAFLQEIAADFTEFVGRVFKTFDEETHVTNLEWHPNWETYAAVDYGVTNPNVWLLLQVSPWGEINVLDEVYEEGLDPEDFADEIRRRGLCPPALKVFFPDPASPGDTRILEKRLGIRHAGGTGGELAARIRWINKALREPRTVKDELDLEPGSRRPQLMFSHNCPKTVKDMLNYRYPDKKASLTGETSTAKYNAPMKKDDHGPEALGRFFAGYFGTFGQPQTGARIHSATFSRYPNPTTQTDSAPSRYVERNRAPFPRVQENAPIDALGAYLEGAY